MINPFKSIRLYSLQEPELAVEKANIHLRNDVCSPDSHSNDNL